MKDEQRLAEIESELGKITQGEWRCEIYSDVGAMLVQEDRGAAAFGVKPNGEPDYDDCNFCAKAPERIRFLLGRVRELEKENQSRREALEILQGIRSFPKKEGER